MREIADDLDVHEVLLYRWRKRYTADSDKTRYATLEEEHKALKLELVEVKMERDMVKKPRLTLRTSTSHFRVYK